MCSVREASAQSEVDVTPSSTLSRTGTTLSRTNTALSRTGTERRARQGSVFVQLLSAGLNLASETSNKRSPSRLASGLLGIM